MEYKKVKLEELAGIFKRAGIPATFQLEDGSLMSLILQGQAGSLQIKRYGYGEALQVLIEKKPQKTVYQCTVHHENRVFSFVLDHNEKEHDCVSNITNKLSEIFENAEIEVTEKEIDQ